MHRSPKNHFLFLCHLHLGTGVSRTCSLADLRTMIIVAYHSHAFSKSRTQSLPYLTYAHLVSFPVLLEVHSKYCWRFVCCMVKVRSPYGQWIEPLSNYASYISNFASQLPLPNFALHGKFERHMIRMPTVITHVVLCHLPSCEVSPQERVSSHEV